MSMKLTTLVLTVLLGMFLTANPAAAVPPAYNSIPTSLPDNVASVGLEAVGLAQFGDGMSLALTLPHNRVTNVTVVMSSWACQNGNWYTAGTCVTTPGTTYTIPITLNIYSAVMGTSLEGNPAYAPGALLKSVTQEFSLPYRPSSDSTNCDGTAWYDATKRVCSHGVAVPITFAPGTLVLPNNIIVTVAYNTSDDGPNPIGDNTPCHATTAGCFYDSLNISADDNNGAYAASGSPLDVTGIFAEYYAASVSNSCSPSTVTPGVLGDDATPGCWTNYHPEIKITVH